MGCVSSSDGLIVQFEGRPLCTDDIVGCSSSGWLSARSTVHRTLMIGSMSVGADDLHLEPQTALGIASSCTRLLCLEDDPSVPGCRHAHLPRGGPAQLRCVPRPDLDLKARIGHRIASPNQHVTSTGAHEEGGTRRVGGGGGARSTRCMVKVKPKSRRPRSQPLTLQSPREASSTVTVAGLSCRVLMTSAATFLPW